MMKLTALGALSLMASGLFAQGLNPGGQSKDSWEEINFEFNSSILSDGYPSLLRLADVVNQHKDYKIKITGHTDYVGSAAYNEKLALSRAEAVKQFLVKYGAADNQITTAGDGKRNPEVDNATKEGRFMNRRVVLTVTDANGKLITEGGISDVLPIMTALQDMAKKQQDCCDQILKRLDKLDDILAALKNLQGENDRLRNEVADLRNQQNSLKDQVNNLHPLTEPQAQQISQAGTTATAKAVADDVTAKNKIMSNVAINLGPAFGSGNGSPGAGNGLAATAHGQLFAPFGADRNHAVQAQAEYMYFPGRQEGQFDIGLLDRIGNFQAGGFASFKYLNFAQYQNGGALGQGSFLVDYLFRGGKVGVFGTKGFKNYAVLNSVTLAPGAFLQTYARIDDQVGFDATVGVWKTAYVQGNAGVIFSHTQENRPGFTVKLVQPIIPRLAFTAELGYNETYLNTKDSGRVGFGLLFGNIMNPRDFSKIKTPVPMEIPRVRYELGTRRVGSSPPIADAGPNQLNITAGTVTLDGSGSYDPLGEALTYSWMQISGPAVTLTSPNTAKTSFAALAGNTYAFRLTVKNTDGLQATATTTVSTSTPGQVRILQFSASPTSITPGQTSTINWVVENATTVTINPTLGTVDAHSGTSTVSPSQTTTYTLTATGAGGTVNATLTVTVSAAPSGNPQIVRFEANPVTISPGQQATLSWTTTGANTVAISGLGSEPLNGSATVSPAQTTTYVLTASTTDGHSVTAPVTVTVAPGTIPQVVVFTANPQTISSGQASKVCWQVNGATSISITPGIGSNLNANDCATVSPAQTTTYTLTATNATGQIQANTTVNVGQVQILSFTATPAFVPVQGNPVTLAWQTVNATSVVIVGADLPAQGVLPVNGSITVVPMQNEIYTLTAYGPGGQTTSVSISVFVR